ncbi:acyl-CoA dehydrogenase/oxidase [Crepidotus variabilis]|uniref:Acyl-CoA dehydrogenase/oxidase n=1 Tax=Crepidotus variabilis TaxID=179855 RepID=A0A9P6EPZ4_9AGAR|nr:acyl-CoA dehydrogenase/oxidase [Crepidotus variabilis]
MHIEEGFQPVPFSNENAYLTDPVLPSLLKRILPRNVLQEVEPDLERLGLEVVTTIRKLSDSHKVYPPKLVQYDQWGRRIDDLQTSEGWRELKAIAQREGLPGIFYERKYGAASRIYGFAKQLLLAGDTHVIFCPISMADGSARVIELYGSPAMRRDILPRLTSRDPNVAFTSGQWMTERPGGSDVSMTETTATSVGQNHEYGPQYSLNGVKWFSSATDCELTVALARTGTVQEGSRGLSLFLIPLRLPFPTDPSKPLPVQKMNQVFVHRLKNKIGTQIVPTAELTLEGSEAYLIGQLGKGVKSISPVLNITRLWSAIGSVGNLRKGLSIATSYAHVRSIKSGTQLLKDTSTHVEQLASINLLYRALVHLVFGVVCLLGKVECGTATKEEEARLRMLTPVAKAYAAEKACTATEESMAALGGAGYMEENGFGRLIRDGLVEKIWEGTIVVLAHDLVRAVQDQSTVTAFVSWANSIIDSGPTQMQTTLSFHISLLRLALQEISTCYTPPIQPLVARPTLFLVGAVTASISLLEHAIWSSQSSEPSSKLDLEIFSRWVSEGGLGESIDAVKRARTMDSATRITSNSEIVFGSSPRSRL